MYPEFISCSQSSIIRAHFVCPDSLTSFSSPTISTSMTLASPPSFIVSIVVSPLLPKPISHPNPFDSKPSYVSPLISIFDYLRLFLRPFLLMFLWLKPDSLSFPLHLTQSYPLISLQACFPLGRGPLAIAWQSLYIIPHHPSYPPRLLPHPPPFHQFHLHCLLTYIHANLDQEWYS